jgi:predicted O-methyltransferase YrrM
MQGSPYEFTNAWFAPHAPIWSRLLAQLKPARVLEIGSYEGQSACFLIEACAAFAPMEIVCVDHWRGGAEHDAAAMPDVEARFERNVERAQAKAAHPARVRKLKERSVVALASLIADGEAGAFDLVYVDGSHQAPDVLADAMLAFQLTRVGGFIFFDDYLWHDEEAGAQDLLNMPKLAIDAFVNIYQRKLGIVGDAPMRQLFVSKLSD